MTITFPEDMFVEKENQPVCVFLEMFPSSQDPYETFYGEYFCNLANEGECAKDCKGDYLLCNLRERLTKRKPDFANAPQKSSVGSSRQDQTTKSK